MRILLGVLIISLLSSSCSEKKINTFLQEQEISMAPPRINVTSAIIDSSVVITADLRLAGIEVFYTHDESDPTRESSSLKESLIVKEEGVYRFKAFHPDWKPSEVTTLRLYKKGQIPNDIIWHTTANSTYPGLGPLTLINQQKASLDYKNPQWVGFNTIVNSTVTFEKKPFIKSMSVGYLIDANSWIFPPESITLLVNNTDTIQVSIDSIAQTEPIKMKDIVVPIEKEVSSLKITLHNVVLPEWHPSKGNKAWLFMDEWIFN